MLSAHWNYTNDKPHVSLTLLQFKHPSKIFAFSENSTTVTHVQLVIQYTPWSFFQHLISYSSLHICTTANSCLMQCSASASRISAYFSGHFKLSSCLPTLHLISTFNQPFDWCFHERSVHPDRNSIISFQRWIINYCPLTRITYPILHFSKSTFLQTLCPYNYESIKMWKISV